MADLRSDTGPFAIIPMWVLEADVPDRAVRLYGVLAKYADNETGECYPSRQTLADHLHTSLDSVDRATAALVDLGAVTKHARKDAAGDPTSNLYVLHRVSPVSSTSTGAVEGSRSVAVTPPQGEPVGSRTGAARTRPMNINPSAGRPPAAGVRRSPSGDRDPDAVIGQPNPTTSIDEIRERDRRAAEEAVPMPAGFRDATTRGDPAEMVPGDPDMEKPPERERADLA